MKRNLIVFLISIFCYFFNTKISAQEDSKRSYCDKYIDNIPPLPREFVTQDSTEMYIHKFQNGWFLNQSKYKRLVEKNGSQDTCFFYNYEAVNNLIDKCKTYLGKTYDPIKDGIRMYFARYSDSDPCPLSGVKFKNNELILLFAAVSSVNCTASPTMYYVLNINDPNVYEVCPANAEKWKENYKIDLQKLNRTINRHDPSCYDQDKLNFSDTKSILYRMDNIIEAVTQEHDYQICHNNVSISGFKFCFASYLRQGKKAVDFNGKPVNIYKKRLFVIFKYMQQKDNMDVEFSLEDQPEFQYRQWKLRQESPLPPLCIDKLDYVITSSGGDNNQLCPTNCKP